ncbi:MAG: hypothetical protein WCR69_01130 [Sulfuricurvum sp.]
MAVGAVANNIFVNQQAETVSGVIAAHVNKADANTAFLQTMSEQKEREVEKISPTEENTALDADSDGGNGEFEQQGQKKQKDKPKPKLHILDIKV